MTINRENNILAVNLIFIAVLSLYEKLTKKSLKKILFSIKIR